MHCHHKLIIKRFWTQCVWYLMLVSGVLTKQFDSRQFRVEVQLVIESYKILHNTAVFLQNWLDPTCLLQVSQANIISKTCKIFVDFLYSIKDHSDLSTISFLNLIGTRIISYSIIADLHVWYIMCKFPHRIVSHLFKYFKVWLVTIDKNRYAVSL